MERPNKSVPRSSRRAFTKALAAAAVAPLATQHASQAADKAKVDRPILDTAEACMQIVQGRYGKFLTEEQLKEVAQSVVRRQYAAEALRRVKLRNSDEPAFAFRADLP